MTSGNHPPWGILVTLVARNARSTRRKPTAPAMTIHRGLRHSIRTTTKNETGVDGEGAGYRHPVSGGERTPRHRRGGQRGSRRGPRSASRARLDHSSSAGLKVYKLGLDRWSRTGLVVEKIGDGVTGAVSWPRWRRRPQGGRCPMYGGGTPASAPNARPLLSPHAQRQPIRGAPATGSPHDIQSGVKRRVLRTPCRCRRRRRGSAARKSPASSVHCCMQTQRPGNNAGTMTWPCRHRALSGGPTSDLWVSRVRELRRSGALGVGCRPA